jgi:Mg2+ and Co2+ transporter CorA
MRLRLSPIPHCACKRRRSDVCVSANAIITIHHGDMELIDASWRRWQVARQTVALNQGILLHGVLDTVVDSYFPSIDEIGDAVDDLETRVLSGSIPLRNFAMYCN